MRYVLLGVLLLFLIDRFVVHVAWYLPAVTIAVLAVILLALRR